MDDSPINVPNVKNLSVPPSHNTRRTQELDINRCPAEVRPHGKVSDTSGDVDARSDVEEDPICAWLQRAGCNDTQCGDAHDGADRVVEVRAGRGDGDGDVFVILRIGVDGERIVALVEVVFHLEKG